MKIVLDTNVLVSGLISPGGPCGRILALAAEGVLPLCHDERILSEYERVLSRDELKIDREDAVAILAVISEVGESVTPAPLGVRLPDSDDLCFIETAATAGAILVTGNARHFPRHARAGVAVLTPREFIDLLSTGPGGREP